MRVVEPKHFGQGHKEQKKHRGKKPIYPVLLILLCGSIAGIIFFPKKTTAPPTNNTVEFEQSATIESSSIENPDIKNEDPLASKTKTLRTFTAEEFKQLYRSVAYPNTEPLKERPEITGDKTADKRIWQIAERRGYKISSVPVASIHKTDEKNLDGDDLLQPLALLSWRNLRDDAKKQKIPLILNSGYRPITYQRDLFIQRLADKGATAEKIAAGLNDGLVESTLHQAAPPGYSRHHTGYTVDLWCEDGSFQFADSICFTWLKKDNYKQAKKHGWIPSYPEGTDEQGPEPEAWEYVWMGADTLTK